MRTCVCSDGVEYLLGSAGGFIIACPICGEEHFREARDYFLHPEWHKCMTCSNSQMEPIKIDELETRWYPFWISLGHSVPNYKGDK